MSRVDTEFPIVIRLAPKSGLGRERLAEALIALEEAEPAYAEIDINDGNTIIKAGSEFDLDVLVDRLIREFGVDLKVGAPQVAYLETISHEVEHTFTHQDQSRGSRRFAEVTMIISPIEPEEDYTEDYSFVCKVDDEKIPNHFISEIEKGIKSVVCSGPLAGFPVTNIRVTLIDGKTHETESDELAFEIAARMCVRHAIKKAGVEFLEPVMKVETTTPDDCSADVIEDLRRRRGEIFGRDACADAISVSAHVPLSNMLGYINTLRSISAGRAQFTMRFSHYAAVPQRKDPDDDPPLAMAL